MPAYEKCRDTVCGDCGHFIRHYIWLPGRFSPLGVGHCAHPRRKDRREDQSCPLWVPRAPEQDPPEDAKAPGR